MTYNAIKKGFEQVHFVHILKTITDFKRIKFEFSVSDI